MVHEQPKTVLLSLRETLRHQHTQQTAALFFTVIFAMHVLLLHGGLSGYVLCIGGDGHVALERSADEMTCADTDNSSHSPALAAHGGNCCELDADHCGDCRDISLTPDCQDEQARNPQKTVEIPAIQSLGVSVSPGDPGAVERRHQTPAFSYLTTYHLSLVSLRSTVLLI